jgi:hypothetical protein
MISLYTVDKIILILESDFGGGFMKFSIHFLKCYKSMVMLHCLSLLKGNILFH